MIRTVKRRFLACSTLWTRLRPGRRAGISGLISVASGPALLLSAGLLAGCSSGEPTPEKAVPAGTSPGVTLPAEEPGGTRRLIPRMVVPLEPMGEANLAGGFVFRWEAPEAVVVESWRLRIFSETMNQIWSSQRLTATELPAPQSLLMKLEPGKTYVWRVAGRLEGGGRIASTDARMVAR